MSASSLVSELFGMQWYYLISVFLYFFTGTLMLLLFEYLKDAGKMKSKITSFDYSYAVKSPKISVSFITIFLTALAVGTLAYWTVVAARKQESLYLSSHLLLSTMLFSICLVFASKLTLLSGIIGYINVFTSGLLLAAFSLCTIAILDGYLLLHLPYVLFGIASGMLISSCYLSLKEITSYPVDDVAFGIFHSSLVSGAIAGIMLSSLITSYRYSPVIFVSLIILSSSIFYIRHIQQSGRSYSISG
jgi:hypothetical protein